MLLAVNHISKYFGGQHILDNISFMLNARDRVGLVGENGVGKSTLLRIITGELESEAGDVSLAPRTTLGYLPQALASFGTHTIDSFIAELQGELNALSMRMRELESAMASQGMHLQAVMDDYAEVSEHFERIGGYDLDHRIDTVMAGLGIAHLPRDRALDTLSGGEKERVGLAALLLHAPDLLLLDEPTNHLDFAAMAWLEGYVRSHTGALLVVSHDRKFLNNTVTSIVEIDAHTRQLKTYTGNFDAYQIAKAREDVQWQLDYEAQQEEIKELRKKIRSNGGIVTWHGGGKAGGDKFAKGFFKGRSQAAISRHIQNAEERLARIEADPIPRPPDEIRIAPQFDPTALEGKSPIRVQNLHKHYGARVVVNDVSFEVGVRDRIVIVGENGSGKSTLLRMIAGELPSDAGTVTIARAANIGYLDQEQASLPADQIAFEWWRAGLTGEEDALRAEFFRFFLLTNDDSRKRIGALSIGQRRKLQLLKLIAQKANVLLLDEPTNHISFDVLEKFEKALAAFDGPVLAVSHDRWFIERFGGKVWEMTDGRLIAQG
jgi:macrolide transport system ATP-binding/permease protein